MTDLMKRLEEATEGSDALTADVWRIVSQNGAKYCEMVLREAGYTDKNIDSGLANNCEPYTTSIDAALTLVPEGWALWLTQNASSMKWMCILHSNRLAKQVSVGATIDDEPIATPALALCIAALKAREASE